MARALLSSSNARPVHELGPSEPGLSAGRDAPPMPSGPSCCGSCISFMGAIRAECFGMRLGPYIRQ